MNRVFVYGTLKSGHCNHYLLSDYKKSHRAVVNGRLYGTAIPFADIDNVLFRSECNDDIDSYIIDAIKPAYVDCSGEVIFGELYEFDYFDMSSMDILEGFGRGRSAYKRVVTTAKSLDTRENFCCWMYVCPDCKSIAAGRGLKPYKEWL